MSEKPLLDVTGLGTLVALFSITAIGLGTCAMERWRIGSWKNELNWVPNSSTYIYSLKAGEFTEKLNVRGECYRFRTYPANNRVAVYGVRRDGRLTPRPQGCPTNGNRCPVQQFRLMKDGYLFVERVWAGQRVARCKQVRLVKGWVGYASPSTSKILASHRP